jgi:hypothetical protein
MAQPLQGRKYLKRRSALKEAQPLQVAALKGRGFSRAIKSSQK